MAKLSKQPAPGISEEERKKRLAEAGFSLRRNKRTGGFCTVKKGQAKKTKKSKI